MAYDGAAWRERGPAPRKHNWGLIGGVAAAFVALCAFGADTLRTSESRIKGAQSENVLASFSDFIRCGIPIAPHKENPLCD